MCPKNWWPEITGVTNLALEEYYEGESMEVEADSTEEEDESE